MTENWKLLTSRTPFHYTHYLDDQQLDEVLTEIKEYSTVYHISALMSPTHNNIRIPVICIKDELLPNVDVKSINETYYSIQTSLLRMHVKIAIDTYNPITNEQSNFILLICPVELLNNWELTGSWLNLFKMIESRNIEIILAPINIFYKYDDKEIIGFMKKYEETKQRGLISIQSQFIDMKPINVLRLYLNNDLKRIGFSRFKPQDLKTVYKRLLAIKTIETKSSNYCDSCKHIYKEMGFI